MKRALACSLLALAGRAAAAGSVTYEIEPAERSVTIQVGRAGLLKFAGHTHEVVAPVFGGQVVVDDEQLARSSVMVEFETAALRVTGKGEPKEDVPKVQENMVGPKVLEVARYPKVAFRSRSVEGRKVSAGVYEIVVSGDLSLHGATRAVVLPLRIEMSGDTLTATGRTTLRHTDFGMKPLSVGGVVNVKNELGVELNVVARKKPAP
jgi:polyisoprenoid-binding protein YceI